MKTHGIYRYLEAKGLLEHGTPENIAQAKKEYWRLRKNELKREQRKREQQFTVSYTGDEAKIIKEAAQRMKISRTRYIKQASLGRWHIPDTGAIRTLLYQNYTALEELCRDSQVHDAVVGLLFKRMEELERTLQEALSHAKPANH